MKTPLPEIYPITDVGISGLSHADQVERLIEGGASVIQLRDKMAAPRDFYEAAKAAVDVARLHSVKIIINDRTDIALALKTDGVHVGQDDLPPEQIRRILGEEAVIGYSTHSVEQAIQAVKLPIDYIAIGPVFATQTKANSEPMVGLDGLTQVRKAIGTFPLVAIGGITLENAASVFANGADAVAVIRALLNDPANIAETMRKLLNR